MIMDAGWGLITEAYLLALLRKPNWPWQACQTAGSLQEKLQRNIANGRITWLRVVRLTNKEHLQIWAFSFLVYLFQKSYTRFLPFAIVVGLVLSFWRAFFPSAPGSVVPHPGHRKTANPLISASKEMERWGSIPLPQGICWTASWAINTERKARF